MRCEPIPFTPGCYGRQLRVADVDRQQLPGCCCRQAFLPYSRGVASTDWRRNARGPCFPHGL
eukprot:364684-Chlamydomonas_euryale.AAC.8